MLNEVIAHGNPQITPAVVVTAQVAGDGEHAAGLLTGCGQDQRADRDHPLVTVHGADMRPSRVEERKVTRGEEDAGEGLADKVAVVGWRARDALDLGRGEPARVVHHGRGRQYTGKLQHVVRGHRESLALEQVRHNA
jgi:hypothetical protein